MPALEKGSPRYSSYVIGDDEWAMIDLIIDVLEVCRLYDPIKNN